MGFLVPAFLFGLAALAVPLVMHLRHREKGQPVRFPSLMFLEPLAIRTSRRQRITDWPLLLLRALALALLVLAFARPFASGGAAAADARTAKAVVVLLDRSLSMGHADVWPAALDSARRLVRELGPEDRVALVTFDEEAEVAQPLTTDRGAVDALLASATPGTRGTRYVAALRVARQVLLDAPAVPAEVVLITDLQQAGVRGLVGLELPARVAVRAVNVTAADRGNVSVADVDVRRVADAERTRLAVQARVRARALDGPRTLTARLELDGRESGVQSLELPADGERLVSFDAVPLPAGRVRGRILLAASGGALDRLAADDTFHFALAGEDALPVTLLASDEALRTETLFAERALAIGRAPTVRITRARPGALSDAMLRDAQLAIVWDTPLAAAEASALETFVTAGGGAVIVVGRRLGERGTTAPLGGVTADGLADRFADRGGSFGELRNDHPLFSAFRETPTALTGARFLRYARVEAGSGQEVLARFDDGLPAVLEARRGAGRVITVVAPLDTRAGDLPLQPAFLPFLRRLVLHGSGHEAEPLWRESGATWALPRALRDAAVTTPSGSLLRPDVRDSLGAAVPLAERGVYAAYSGVVSGDPIVTVAVNPPAVESDLTPVDARELLVGVATGTDDADASAEPATALERERRQGWWRWLVAAAALLLIGETLLANRGWRGRAARATLTQASFPGPEAKAP
jgi:hypothetical protein